MCHNSIWFEVWAFVLCGKKSSWEEAIYGIGNKLIVGISKDTVSVLYSYTAPVDTASRSMLRAFPSSLSHSW